MATNIKYHRGNAVSALQRSSQCAKYVVTAVSFPVIWLFHMDSILNTWNMGHHISAPVCGWCSNIPTYVFILINGINVFVSIVVICLTVDSIEHCDLITCTLRRTVTVKKLVCINSILPSNMHIFVYGENHTGCSVVIGHQISNKMQ